MEEKELVVSPWKENLGRALGKGHDIYFSLCGHFVWPVNGVIVWFVFFDDCPVEPTVYLLLGGAFLIVPHLCSRGYSFLAAKLRRPGPKSVIDTVSSLFRGANPIFFAIAGSAFYNVNPETLYLKEGVCPTTVLRFNSFIVYLLFAGLSLAAFVALSLVWAAVGAACGGGHQIGPRKASKLQKAVMKKQQQKG